MENNTSAGEKKRTCNAINVDVPPSSQIRPTQRPQLQVEHVASSNTVMVKSEWFSFQKSLAST